MGWWCDGMDGFALVGEQIIGGDSARWIGGAMAWMGLLWSVNRSSVATQLVGLVMARMGLHGSVNRSAHGGCDGSGGFETRMMERGMAVWMSCIALIGERISTVVVW
jgi:hypothetical protein